MARQKAGNVSRFGSTANLTVAAKATAAAVPRVNAIAPAGARCPQLQAEQQRRTSGP
jgi:hypothetical protein